MVKAILYWLYCKMLVKYLSDIILAILVLLFSWCFTTIYTDVVVLLWFLSYLWLSSFLTIICVTFPTVSWNVLHIKITLCVMTNFKNWNWVPKQKCQRQPNRLSTMDNETHWQNLAHNIQEKDKKDTLQINIKNVVYIIWVVIHIYKEVLFMYLLRFNIGFSTIVFTGSVIFDHLATWPLNSS